MKDFYPDYGEINEKLDKLGMSIRGMIKTTEEMSDKLRSIYVRADVWAVQEQTRKDLEFDVLQMRQIDGT